MGQAQSELEDYQSAVDSLQTGKIVIIEAAITFCVAWSFTYWWHTRWKVLDQLIYRYVIMCNYHLSKTYDVVFRV